MSVTGAQMKCKLELKLSSLARVLIYCHTFCFLVLALISFFGALCWCSWRKLELMKVLMFTEVLDL